MQALPAPNFMIILMKNRIMLIFLSWKAPFFNYLLTFASRFKKMGILLKRYKKGGARASTPQRCHKKIKVQCLK